MSRYNLAVIVGVLLSPFLARAEDPSALWLEPSQQWYGIDGNWSATTFSLGTPEQKVDVTVSTSLAEIWIVEDGGCGSSALCDTARGGVYDTSASSSWASLGPWQLGLTYLGIGGNGDYAMETVGVYDSARHRQTSFDKQIVAAINDTGYYTGFFGLGIMAGNFDGVVAQSPISSLVEQDGVIPSHSYGYTAGAYYGGSSGTPLSLTLGGYDANRFEPHGTEFSLNASAPQLETLVRSITTSVSDTSKAPTSWASSSISLSYFNESVTALIDGSTPYLWLPPVICDRFATAFNLTWNETLGLYLFSSIENLEAYRSSPDLTFTFTLSSKDNLDDFGQPLDVPGVVNITISANAFIQNLRYPFMDIIGYGSPAVPYFPLKPTDNNSQVIIGRSFLQEAYIITNYEKSTFSVHQAKFPDDPADTSIQTIAYDPSSSYPGPASRTTSAKGLTHTQLIGLIVGVCLVGTAIVATIWFMHRRRRQQQTLATSQEDSFKDEISTADLEQPRSPISRILSKVVNNHRWRKGKKEERSTGAVEVGADHTHERYEMPAQLAPVELDATETMSSTWVTDAENHDAQHYSEYELSSRHLQQQLQGPVPAYTPRVVEPSRKSYEDVSPVPHWRPMDHLENPSPASSPAQEEYSNRMPSPLTPRSDWTNNAQDVSSLGGMIPGRTLSHSSSNPMMYSPSSLNSPLTADPACLTRSASSGGSPISYQPSTFLLPPSPTFKRPSIDPSKVICLGPLADNVGLPQQEPEPQIQRSASPNVRQEPEVSTIDCGEELRRKSTTETLGSNFTIEQEALEVETSVPAHTMGRMDGFEDMVHVPQPAHKRYSWEQDQ
ncbi:aspartic peptidase domain-containing protein [Xylariaceae sp. FL0016]|nr:aspartic peptidase domain-containing protein [Xylariaceae sp. FL0016]